MMAYFFFLLPNGQLESRLKISVQLKLLFQHINIPSPAF